MSGISHPSNQNGFLGTRSFLHSIPAVLPLSHLKQAQASLVPHILTEDDPLPPSQRLVVILPDANIDILSLPRRIWDLAAPDHRQVLLMSKPCREENEYFVRLNLATLAAIIRDPGVSVETHVVVGSSLDKAAQQCSQPDDIFVCFEEHLVPGFLKKNRLVDLLAQKGKLPVYALKGPVSEATDPITSRLIDFVLMVVCLVVLGGFFAIQVWIDQYVWGMLRMISQVLTVLVEISILAACANKASRF